MANMKEGSKALASAAFRLEEAGTQIQAADEEASEVKLLAEEVRDVLARVKAERVKLGCR